MPKSLEFREEIIWHLLRINGDDTDADAMFLAEKLAAEKVISESFVAKELQEACNMLGKNGCEINEENTTFVKNIITVLNGIRTKPQLPKKVHRREK